MSVLTWIDKLRQTQKIKNQRNGIHPHRQVRPPFAESEIPWPESAIHSDMRTGSREAERELGKRKCTKCRACQEGLLSKAMASRSVSVTLPRLRLTADPLHTHIYTDIYYYS